MSKKLFDFCIGNPPYQQEQVSLDSEGSLKNYAPPVYNTFMDAANSVSDKVELIHPARFLFNAGSTPKVWNEKMLNDSHFKVLHYEEDATVVFPNTDIKGGIAITYHDHDNDFGAIEVFTKYSALNSILKKVNHNESFKSLMDIVYSRTAYRLTEKMHTDYPVARYKKNAAGQNIGRLSKGHDYDMSSNIMERLPEIFHDNIPQDDNKYIRIIGRSSNKRVYKYIRKDYVNDVDNLYFYKVLVPQANGNGTFGETITQPVVQKPEEGNTETFISLGKFDTEKEAENLIKYLSTKFLRTMLSVLKVTQNGNKPVWKYVPLQNFTPTSDIDWSKPVHVIDLQLYRKYNLTKEEIDFIESNVKEMV